MTEKKTFITTRVKTLVPKTWQLLLLCVKVPVGMCIVEDIGQ